MLPVATLDAAMVLAETAEMPLHTLGILILEPLEEPEGSPYQVMREMFEARLYLVPPFRRRLVQGPMRLGDLHWVEDPDFDLDRHLLRATLPAPGGDAELAALVGAYAARLLDRDKPLWEVMLVEGLEGGRVAAVAKVHHAAMDGGRLVALLGHLFDRSPDGILEPLGQDPWKGEALPSTLFLAADTVRTLAGKPGRVIQAVADIAGALRRSRGTRSAGGETAGSARTAGSPEQPPIEVPRTPWMGALTTHRAVSFADVPLEDLRAIRTAYGTTINDVILAACSETLRRWLLAHGALPDRPLIANVPIAVRGAEDDGSAGNQVSMLRVHLPIGEEDPVACLRLIHAETQRSKAAHHASGGNVLSRFTDLALNLTVPWLLTQAVELFSRSGAADYTPALWNVVISNVPGPGHDLYCAGAKVTRIYPFGPVQHGSGLNLTVLSTPERMCLGAMACTEHVPDLDAVAQGFSEAVAALLERASSEA